MIIRLILTILFVLSIFAGCAKLPDNQSRLYSTSFSDIDDTLLAKTVNVEKENKNADSGFYLLGNGIDAFVARVALIRLAEKSLDVQYYIYHNDLTGNILMYELLKAAKRGVRIRILLDDLNMDNWDDDLVAINMFPNVEVRLFNPFNRKTSRASQLLTHERAITRRMHNKSFTADNSATILGGRNIGNEYFNANTTVNFADLDVLGIGQVAKDVSKSFDMYWNSELSYPVDILIKDKLTKEEYDKKLEEFRKYLVENSKSKYIEAMKNTEFLNKLTQKKLQYYWGNAVIVYDKPQKILTSLSDKRYNLTPQLKPYIDKITKEMIILSPYFVPGKAGSEFLIDLVKKGIKVKILTNSLASNDVGIVHSGYSKYRKDLLKGGVELYEMNKKLTKQEKKKMIGSSKVSLHAKSFIFDRHIVFIGSLNLDPRSEIHNTEIGVLIDSKDMANMLADSFQRDIKYAAFKLELDKDDNIIWKGIVDGKEVIFEHDPYTGFWRRLFIDLMKILPIESQL